MINVSSINTGTTVTNNGEFLESIRNEMVIDLIKSFFSAIYSDGYKHRISTDISTLNTIFQENGTNMLTSSQDKEVLFNELIEKYRKSLQAFKENDCENLVYECLKLYRTSSHVTINPYMFFYSFIDIPYSHIQMVFKKIPNISRLSNNSLQTQISEPDFSNNLENMNTFFEDEQRDIIVYGLKLIRFLPFFLFNTYVLGGGNFHSQALSLLGNVNQFITLLNSFKNSGTLYGPIGNFISEELQYITGTLSKEMNSPLTVNEKSRHMVIELISKSVMGPEEFGGVSVL
jgi:hypothetical protein